MRITADTALIIRIRKKLLTRVGGVIAISKFRGGGICWRQYGATTDASLEAQWSSERLVASGGIVVVKSASSVVRGRRVCMKAYAHMR